MVVSAEGEARRALFRFRRAVEKAARELAAVEGALRHAEGDDFPAAAFAQAAATLAQLDAFAEEQGERLADKLLQAGGLEPGRVRRGGGLA